MLRISAAAHCSWVFAECIRRDGNGGSGVLSPYLIIDDAPRLGHRLFEIPREGPVPRARGAERVATDVDAVRGARAFDVEGRQRGQRASEAVTCRAVWQQAGSTPRVRVRVSVRVSASTTTCVKSRPVRTPSGRHYHMVQWLLDMHS